MNIGSDISHYHILEKLGEGGMGIVYKAQDTRLQRTVALKVIRPQVIGDLEVKKRFLREAHTAGLLNHTNITTIYDIDEWQGQDYIVMEYVEGKTVKEIIHNSELRIMNIVDYAMQIAEALKEAHDHHIIHRDVKSGNIMITPQGRVKVMDFGLAKMAGSKTQSGIRTTMGTLAYMSPEQMRGDPLDFRTDIWSLGVVLYEMITRNLPFKGDYEQALLYAVLHKEPEKISALRPDVPPALEQMVCKALAKKKEERFASAQDLLNVLRMLRQNKSIAPLKQDQKKTDHKTDGRKRKKISSAKYFRKIRLIFELTIALFLTVLAFIIITNLRKNTSISRPSGTRLTSYKYIEAYPALSADGSRLAFTWNQNRDNYDIYYKLIGEEGHTQLTSDPALEISATWSHDGNYIAFFRYGENGGIYRKSISGDREIKVADISQIMSHPDMTPRVDWSPDGKWLVYNDYDTLQLTSCIFRLHLDSGEREQITYSEPGLVGDMNAKFSPDGKWVAFDRAYGHRIRELFLLNLNNGDTKQLTFDKKQIDDLAWMPDGKNIVFISNREGIPSLWRVSVHGGQPQRLDIGVDDVFTISIARNAHRLVYARTKFSTDIWQAEIPGDSGIIKPHRLITSDYVDYFPMYSPDDQKIAFNSDRSGIDEIYVCNRDGSNPVRITTSKIHSGVPRWSPSGDYIIYESRPKGNSDVLKIDAFGAAPPINLTDHPADDRVPTWSRDGQHIYFYSKHSEKYQIYKMPAAGGEPVQITRDGGNMGFESFDGSCFYFKKFDDMREWIYRIELRTQEESVVIDECVSTFRWSVEKAGIYYIAADNDKNHVLKLYHEDTGQIEKLGTFENFYNFWDVSNDGIHILLWCGEGHSGDIYMVDNFR